MITECFRLLIVLLSGGKLDYLPGANHPWSADIFRSKKQGRGKTAFGALRHHLLGGPSR